MPKGRGVKSVYCPTCQAERKARASALRGQRHALAQMAELVETIGPRVYLMRKEVTTKQDGRCGRCTKHRRLYLAGDESGDIAGLCLDCFGAWTQERRGKHDGRQHAPDPE